MGTECWIRLNTRDGKFDCIKTNPALWTYSLSSDLAIIKSPLLDINRYDITSISTAMFLDKERLVSTGVGVGDETFVVGRFVNHEGKQRNRPTAHFGAISMMPDAEDGVFNEYLGKDIEAYLVEIHTVGGYSGSPVGFMIPPFSNRPEDRQPSWQWRGPWLLGVDFCHIVTYDDVYEPAKGKLAVKGKLTKTEYQAQTSTGMLAVVPAWELLALINEPHLVEDRDEIDAQWERQHARPKTKLEAVPPTTYPTGDDILKVMLNTPPKGE